MQVGEIKYDSYGSPQPISKLDDSQEFKGEDTKSDPPVTVSNSKKRKAETAVEKTNELETQILLPTDKDDVITNLIILLILLMDHLLERNCKLSWVADFTRWYLVQ